MENENTLNDNNGNTDEKKTIKVKKDIDWHFINDYFSFIKNLPKLFEDERFANLYQQMEAIIYEKIDTGINGDIVRSYIIEEIELKE